MHLLGLGQEPPKCERTAKANAALHEMYDLFAEFGKIAKPAPALKASIKKLSVAKYAEFLQTHAVCRVPDRRERADVIMKTAHWFIDDPGFGEHKIERLSRRYQFIKAHFRARRMKAGLPPPLPAGINVKFLDHVEEFNRILFHLRKFSRSTREHLLRNIQVLPFLVNRYLGDDIWDYFVETAPKLPRPPFGAMLW